MKNILLVAGGHNQVSLAQKVVELGHRLILVDPNYDAPCSQFSSYHIKCDTRHYLDLIQSIKEMGLVIDGVLSDQSDAALLSVSAIAQEFNLPHIPINVIRKFLDKLTQNRCLRERGVNAPLTLLVDTRTGEDSLRTSGTFPQSLNSCVVVKPADAQGSKGVNIVHSHLELKKCIESASAESTSGRVLIQEFISGSEYSVDGVVIGRVFHPLVIARKEHYESNPCIDERNTFVGDIPLDRRLNLVACVEGALKAIKIENALIHAELIIRDEDGEAFLIEFSPRGGGGSISSKIVPFLTGYDSNLFTIKMALGEEPQIPKTSPLEIQERFAIMRFFPEYIGSFSELLISEPAESELIHLEKPKGPGLGRPVNDSRCRLGYFVIGGSDLSKLVRDEKLMLESIIFE